MNLLQLSPHNFSALFFSPQSHNILKTAITQVIKVIQLTRQLRFFEPYHYKIDGVFWCAKKVNEW